MTMSASVCRGVSTRLDEQWRAVFRPEGGHAIPFHPPPQSKIIQNQFLTEPVLPDVRNGDPQTSPTVGAGAKPQVATKSSAWSSMAFGFRFRGFGFLRF